MKKKPSMGRPPINPAAVRDRELRIRVNAAEETTLLTASDGNLSAWARDVLLRAAKRKIG